VPTIALALTSQDYTVRIYTQSYILPRPRRRRRAFVLYTYILRSRSCPRKIYSGSTQDLRTRVSEHNSGKSTYTSKFMPWELVFYAAFQEEVTARKFERYLKSGSGRAFAHKRLLSEIRGV
jgi:putative endonuclease